MKTLLLYACCLFTLVSIAATNLISNTAIVTNQCAQIVTYTIDTNGYARVQDPTGRLVGTAEEAALTVAAEGQVEIASAAADAAGTAMEEWREFIRTNDTHVLYIDGHFGQDLPALATNLCGWVASQSFDGTNDHYQIWFNREMDAPPFIQVRIIAARSTNWVDAVWKDWNTTTEIDGVPCRELIVPRCNANRILKHGSTVTFGGRDGFDASVNRCNIEVAGLPAVTTSLTLPLFYTRTRSYSYSKFYVKTGTIEIVRAYTNATLQVENGFIHTPVEETIE